MLNDFVTEMLSTSKPEVTKVWTGGVQGSVAGKTFSLWFESQDKIRFKNFLEENSETPKGEENIVDSGLKK